MLSNKDCVFCKIINGDLPAYKIFEDNNALVFLDISKDFYGHMLVIPKEHYENILDVPVSVLNSVLVTVKKVSEHLVKNCGFEGVNILNACGESSGQSVFHLHFHIIPRKFNDGLKIFPKSNEKNYDLDKICEELKIKV